jgi:DNA-binding LacI/PurR family transcriptional regulator
MEIVWEVNVGFDGVLTPAAIDTLLKHRRKATLIIAGNDLIAISAIRCLTDHGVKVPEDVSITGFDNIRWTDVVRPRLTTIAQPVGAIGAKAVELMQESMSGEKIPTRHTIFDVTLIERDSVRRL